MNDSSEVKLHFLDYWRVVKVRWAILTITFLLVMISAAVTCYFLPREYYSKVTMEVKADDTRLTIFGGNTGIHGTNEQKMTPTQYQILQRKEILYPVIENLKLTETWGPVPGQRMPREQVYEDLVRKMDLREVRNTDLIEIGVWSADKQEAANIANMIAIVYQERRKTDQQAMMNQGLGQLQEEVDKQRKAVNDAQAEAAKIRTEEGIIDPNPESIDSTDFGAQNAVRGDEQQVNDIKIKIAELRTTLQGIEKLTPEELTNALHSLGLEDPTVSKVLPLYNDVFAEDARLANSGLGENHPRVKALRAQKDVYFKQLNAQIAALRISYGTKLKVNEETLKALQEKLTGTRNEWQDTRKKGASYLTAKNKYVAAKHVLDAAESRLVTERMQMQMGLFPAKIWEKAEPALGPGKPNVPLYMFLAVVTGLVFGVALAFFIEYLDTSVKTLEDVERLLAVPVLAVVPKGVTALIKNNGDSPDAEAYRIMQTNMEFNKKNATANTITLVSGGPGEGKSTTLNNLAVTCAKGGYRVLVVDADLRRPTQHFFFDVDNSVGLSDCLTGEKEMDDVILTTSIENLSFLPSGKLPTDAVGILNSQRMSDLIAKAKSRYDLVFFDSPPILGVSDASILSSEVDLTIMVVQYRRFPRDMLVRVKQAILQVGGNLLGAVLNAVDTKHDSGYQYYTQYYDYYTAQPAQQKQKPRTRRDAQTTEPGAPRRSRSDLPHGDY